VSGLACGRIPESPAMRSHHIVLVSSTLLLTGCTVHDVPPPLLVASHQPVQLSRERAYLACAIAVQHAHGDRGLRLRQRYKIKALREQKVRLLQLDGFVLQQGERKPARFLCATDLSRKAQVLSLREISTPSGGVSR